MLFQLVEADSCLSGQRLCGDVLLYRNHIVCGGSIQLHAPDITPGIAIDFQRRQERGVKVARGKPECLALVVVYDHVNVRGAQRLRRARHATGAVVVPGQSQRPGARYPVVGLE